jgi:hypothetical protein
MTLRLAVAEGRLALPPARVRFNFKGGLTEVNSECYVDKASLG